MPSFLSEDDIEREIIRVMKDRWEKDYAFTTLNCHTEDPKDLNDGSNRLDKRDCFLLDKLREAVYRLNDVPESAVEDAIAQLTARRGNMSMVAANREIAALIREGLQCNSMMRKVASKPNASNSSTSMPRFKTPSLL